MKPNSTPRWIALAVLLLLLLPASLPATAQAPPAGQQLHLHFGSFDPLLGPTPPGFALGRLPVSGPYIVQFGYPMGGWEAGAVERAGGSVGAYLPDGAFVVLAGPTFPAKARAIDGVRWVGALPAWARVAPGAEAADHVQVAFAGSPATLLGAVRSLAVRPLTLGAGAAVFEASAGGARALAGLPDVLWVEPYTPPVGLNYQAVTTDRLRTPVNGSSYSTAGGGMWTFDDSGGAFLGYTGAGYSVDVTDLGIDGTHPAFAGRMEAYHSWTSAANWTDGQGHGTHVAGTAVGSGAYLPADASLPDGLFAGAAPGAGLIGQTYNGSALDYAGMADFAVTAGAVASVNSWGDPASATLSNYTAASAAYDTLTADASPAAGAQPLLFVFAAGNENQAPRSILPPATAKNVITVGGTGNDYPGGTSSADVAPFSSFGPTDDVRIKPDLVAPGERISSANSTQDAGSGLLPRPPLGGSSYVYLSGTSQAAPQVAGASAVAAQFLWTTQGIAATPALIKAALINGATPLAGYAWPGPAQGWGRLNVHDALVDSPGHEVEFVREGAYRFTSTLDVYQVNVDLDAGSDLRVTLVWTDAAGSPLASQALVNDLDLEVRDPSDLLIYGGNRINTTSAYSDPGSGAGDHTNNVEAVRVQDAAAGQWKVVVRPYNLPTGAQSFALVLSGAVNRTAPGIVVSPANSSVEAPPGGTAPLNVSLTNLGDGAENVTLAGSPLWANSSMWTVEPLNLSIGPGQTANVTLAIRNNDSGLAGDRGYLEVRATADGTGRSYTATVHVGLAAVRCADLDPFRARAEEGIVLEGQQPADFSFPVTDCGNTPLDVGLFIYTGLEVFGWPDLEVEVQNATVDPGQTATIRATLRAPFELWDTDFDISMTLGTPTAAAKVDVHVFRETGARLNLSGNPEEVVLYGTQGTFTVNVTNEGAAATLHAPQVEGGLYWHGVATPEVAVLGAGETWTVTVNLTRDLPAYPDESTLLLSFGGGAPGGGVLFVNVTWEEAPGPAPPTAPWPTDAGPGLALLAGLAAAGLAAALSARSRALPRTCPRCGHRAARFDTFLNPSCAGCGATLAPKGGSR